MQIRELPRGGQLHIHGNVVNVPADANSTVNVSPRSIHVSQTIPVKLKEDLATSITVNSRMSDQGKFYMLLII